MTLPPEPLPIQLVHLSPQWLVADKPAGLLCVPGRGPDKTDCLVARVQASWPDALTVHRLDMGTSGLVVLARGAAMQRLLSDAFAQRRVHKTYEALVAGWPDGDTGDINLPLAADWPNRPRQQVDRAQGRPSLTRWQVLARGALPGTGLRISRLRLAPITGRTHQLRVHLAAIGHPILGDVLYAPADWQAAAARLMLHACGLQFEPLPGVAAPFEFSSPMPF